jgi:hypothetical protein
MVTVLSNPVDSSRGALEKAITNHWAVLQAPITALEIEEFEEGVRCTLLDESAGKIAKVVYWYALEDDGWKQVKHDIWEVQDVADSGKAEADKAVDTDE